MSRELLIMAILDEGRAMHICYEHERPVWHEEPECPCCRMEYKFTCGEFGHTPLSRLKP
jgi:hypothetical protein